MPPVSRIFSSLATSRTRARVISLRLRKCSPDLSVITSTLPAISTQTIYSLAVGPSSTRKHCERDICVLHARSGMPCSCISDALRANGRRHVSSSPGPILSRIPHSTCLTSSRPYTSHRSHAHALSSGCATITTKHLHITRFPTIMRMHTPGRSQRYTCCPPNKQRRRMLIRQTSGNGENG